MTTLLATGASGSGTTTLGRSLAQKLGTPHLDGDDFYWLPSDVPFTAKRDPADRLRLLEAAMKAQAGAVVSGSVMGWGTAIEDAFDLIVFLVVPTELRTARLIARESALYGCADAAFIEWAASYEGIPTEGRSRSRHEAWLLERKCPILRIEGDTTNEIRVSRVLAALEVC
ncbi:MAG: P-loop NTPase family protein [Candidatus Dormibacteria bacterium]